MTVPIDIHRQINTLISYLVETGLADAQHYAVLKAIGSTMEISFSKSAYVSVALKNLSYGEIYEHLSAARAYNVRMLDGALIQMMYSFDNESVQRHRLAFFPAPDLEEFQNNPEIYLDDELYADVVAKNIVTSPFRFDYDLRYERNDGALYPISHFTLGQYQNCRIPVTAPLTPFRFIEFILRNFYHTAFVRYADTMPNTRSTFLDTIRPRECDTIHLTVPA